MSSKLYGLFLRKKVFLICLTVFVFASCTDSRYLAERLYWQAERKTAQVIKEKGNKLAEADFKEIIGFYKKITDKYPLESLAAQSKFVIANFYVAQSKFDEAAQELKEIINNFSSNTDISSRAYFNLGQLLEIQKKWQDALGEYEKLMDLYPLSSLGLKMPFYIIQHYAAKKDSQAQAAAYAKAIKKYNKLLKEYEKTSIYPMIADYLATLYIKGEEIEQAIKVYDGVIKDYSASPYAIKAFFEKANIYAEKIKDLPKAIAVYKDFLDKYSQKNDTRAKAQLSLGWVLIRNKQPAKAKEMFYSFLNEYPTKDEQLRVNAYLGLSSCLRQEADTNKLTEVFEKMRKEYPNNKASLAVPFLLAQYYDDINNEELSRKEIGRAITEYKRILSDPAVKELRKKETINVLGLCYVKNKDYRQLIALLQESANRYPSDPRYLVDIANIYTSLNNISKAIEVYKEIAKKYSNNEFLVKLSQARIEMLNKKTAQ